MHNSINPSNSLDLTQTSHLSTEYLKNVAWQFRQALHLNDQETIENLLNSASLPLSKKTLLKAMSLTWKANKKAKILLEDLLNTDDLVDKYWVFFSLSEFYLTQGNAKNSIHWSDLVLKEVTNKGSLLPSYLRSLLILWNINLKLVDKPDNFQFDSFTSELNKIISSEDSKLIKGYSYLTLAILEKVNPTTTFSSNFFDYLKQAIDLLKGVDYYYLSLAQLELATSGKLELSERRNLVLSAQTNFKQLNKQTESTKATYLLSELSTQPTISKLPYDSIGNCLFISPSMKEIKEKLEMFVRYNATDPILILGEKGTGKESIASAIEHLSKKTIQSYNCSNLSKELFETVMFGHKKGIFTGANEDRAGLFEATGDGILFLDEIGDLPLECQPKFLRVLQKREFARIGEETKRRKFLGRVVTATNKNLEEMVENGLFRGDLFDRLKVFRVDLPCLNDRREDIIPLAEFFLQLHGQGENFILSKSTRDYLTHKDHPANIRGLETTIKRAIVQAFSKSIRIITKELVKDESSSNTTSKQLSPQQIEPFDTTMDKYEKKVILEALEICGGNRKVTANSLKLLERRLYHLLKKHNINH